MEEKAPNRFEAKLCPFDYFWLFSIRKTFNLNPHLEYDLVAHSLTHWCLLWNDYGWIEYYYYHYFLGRGGWWQVNPFLFCCSKNCLAQGANLGIDVLKKWYKACVSLWYETRPFALYVGTSFLFYFVGIFIFYLIHCSSELHSGKSILWGLNTVI